MEEARANAVLDKVRATLKSGEFKRQDQLIERLLEEGFSSTDIASALLHHLQGGEGAPAAKVAREETGAARAAGVRDGSRGQLRAGTGRCTAGARYEDPCMATGRRRPTRSATTPPRRAPRRGSVLLSLSGTRLPRARR